MQELQENMPDKIVRGESAHSAEQPDGESLKNFAPDPVPAHIAALQDRRTRILARVLVIGVVLLLLAGGGFLAYQFIFKEKPRALDAQPGAAAPVVTVTTVAAQLRPVDDVLSVTGSVSAWDELKIGAELSGLRISSVNVEEGDRVKKGQVLVKLNSSLLETQLAAARARLESSQANLLKSVQPNRPEDLAVLKSLVAQAEDTVTQEEAHKRQLKVDLENAEINVERYKLLDSQGAISDQELETRELTRAKAALELVSAEQKVEAAGRSLEQARERYSLARKGGRAEDVAISKASVNEIKAQISQLAEQIKQTTICTPDDGLVVKRDAHIGDISEPARALFTILRLNRLELRAQVNDSDLSKFRPGQTVSISTSETGARPVIGTVRLVSPQVDPSTRLGTVRIDLPENCPLKSGMFVRGETRLASYRALTVPVDCLVTRGAESFVFTLAGKHAVSTPVQTGVQSETFVEIKHGLSEGQLVIQKGARFLTDHDVVDLAK
jgi:HlyD family secretion protein